jgi:hypothetical protein
MIQKKSAAVVRCQLLLRFSSCLAISSLFFLSRAHACDQITPQSPNYNMALGPTAVLDFVIERKDLKKGCDWYITVDMGAHNNGTYNRFLQNGTPSIGVQIYDQSGSQILKNIPDAVPPGNVISGSFGDSDGATKTVHYKIVLASVPYSTATGTYQNTWQVNLYSRNAGTPQPYHVKNTTNIGAFYQVQPSVDISLTDPGQPFNLWETTQTLDFGNMTLGQQMRFDMQIGNNRPYKFSLTSQNNGFLQRSGTTDTSAINHIHYQTRIASTGFSPAMTIDTYPFSSGTIGPSAGSVVVYPVTVQIMDDPSGKVSGSYQDVVTITLTAL